ncbi:hypothetical protein ACFL35_01635 [Candidatus Riflebacteria bacterium]
MKSTGYRLQDEPAPGILSNLCVNPLWPFFAIMFCGTWFSWPWFIFNGFAIGSPTRFRELLYAVLGFVGNFLIVSGILVLAYKKILSGYGIEYVLILLTIWKLGITYFLFVLQSRTFHIYEYYGGTVKNGLFPIIFCSFLLKGPLFNAIGRNIFSWVLR